MGGAGRIFVCVVLTMAGAGNLSRWLEDVVVAHVRMWTRSRMRNESPCRPGLRPMKWEMMRRRLAGQSRAAEPPRSAQNTHLPVAACMYPVQAVKRVESRPAVDGKSSGKMGVLQGRWMHPDGQPCTRRLCLSLRPYSVRRLPRCPSRPDRLTRHAHMLSTRSPWAGNRGPGPGDAPTPIAMRTCARAWAPGGGGVERKSHRPAGRHSEEASASGDRSSSSTPQTSR